MLFTFFLSLDSTPPPGFACFTNCPISFLPFHPAHDIGHTTCMNPCLLVSLYPLSGVALGAYDKCRCWWNWRGDCAKCLRLVKEMDRIFCANFFESQGGWVPCWMTWHANSYECLGIGKFPVKMHWDMEGNPWFKQKQKEDEINYGVKGVHALIPFQRKRCWMVNLEGRLPEPKLEEMYLMLIR
jgi:hypothetical protein